MVPGSLVSIVARPNCSAAVYVGFPSASWRTAVERVCVMVIRDKTRVECIIRSARTRGKGFLFALPGIGTATVFPRNGRALIVPADGSGRLLAVCWFAFCRFRRRREPISERLQRWE